MDYVDWSNHVLEQILKIGRADEYARAYGLDFWGLGKHLFGDTYPTRANAPDGTAISEALYRPLIDLEQLGWLESSSGMYRVTKIGRDAAREPVAAWREICQLTLEPDQARILSVINANSEQVEDGFAWCGELSDKDYLPALGFTNGRAALAKVLGPLEELAELGLVSMAGATLGDQFVRATYKGLVWEHRRDLTLGTAFLDTLVAEWETSSVDFKRELSLSTADAKASFIKDVLALANTLSSGRRWLIVGFDDKSRAYAAPPDPGISIERLEQLVHEYVTPYLELRWSVISYRGGRVGMLEVLPTRRDLPYRVAKSIGDKKRIEAGQVYVRHGTRNVLASDDELEDLRREAEFAAGP